MDILKNNKPGAQIRRGLSLNYWSNLFLLLYIFFMPFVSAFAFTGTITISLILAVFLFIFMIFSIIRSSLKLPNGFMGFDLIIILCFLFVVIFSFIINGFGNSKSLNHSIAYISTFLLFYAAIKFTLFNIKDKTRLFKRVLQFITLATILSAVYANVEFISSNLFGININDYIPRPSEAEAFYNATVLGEFYRARGFAPESGHFAFMMELFSPIAFYYMFFSGFCKWPLLLKILIVFIIVFSFIFAVSTASFVIIPIALFLSSLIYIKEIFSYVKKRISKTFFSVGVVTVIVLLFNYFFSVNSLILLSISDKLNYGSDIRKENIDFFFKVFRHFDLSKLIIGSGPAGVILLGYDEYNAILNLYYSIAFEIGLIGLLLFVLLLIYIFFNILKIRSKIGFFLMISILSGMMHYFFIANFWYPWFWFIAAFTIFYSHFFSKERSKI